MEFVLFIRFLEFIEFVRFVGVLEWVFGGYGFLDGSRISFYCLRGVSDFRGGREKG